MDIRKIAAVAGFAVAAALTSAPLASADDPLTPIVDSEISSLNSLFELDAAIAGVSGDVMSSSGVLDTINPADAPATIPLTFLDYELYGPLANLLTADFDAEPGAQDVFFGAAAEFDDSFNALAYLILEDSAIIPTTDLVGPADIALDVGPGDGALAATFFDTGLTDILSWFGATFLS